MPNGRLVVEWEGGTTTFEPQRLFLNSVRVDGKRRDAVHLLAMADKPDDDTETLATKAQQRGLFVTQLRLGGERRSATRRASSLPPVDHSDLLVSGICVACGLQSPGRLCTGSDGCPALLCVHCLHSHDIVTFVCPAHGGPMLRLSHDVTQRGVPQSSAVNYHVVSTDPNVGNRIVSPLCVQSERAEAQALFVVYHADPGWTAAEHIAIVSDAMAGAARVKIVVVLSCWINAAEQQRAMKQLSYDWRKLLFITFRIPELVVTPVLLSHAAMHVADAVRHPSPYLSLSQLCTLQTRAVLFEEGLGPYQVASQSVPRCSCGRAYPSDSKRRRAGQSLRTRKCSEGAFDCLYLLLVAAASTP